jgi:NAD(P)-dependent dehydrogenase (short-subunit alcohol dehydrogenase family)
MKILITGANRGIGLALTKLYRSQNHDVIAAVRKSSDALDETGARVIEGIDVRNDADMSKLVEDLKGSSLDLLILNAGLMIPDDIGDVRMADVQQQIEVNAVGPLRVTHALLPSLNEGAKIAIITSRMGSLSDNSSGGFYGYRMSKAAVNAFGVSLALDLKAHEISVAILHPGFVRTEMTGGHGQIETEVSAQGLAARIEALTLETSGQFLHMNGEPLGW